MRRALLSLLLICALPAGGAEPRHGGPVIDMHLHAFSMDELPPGAPACPGDQQVLIPTIDPKEAVDFAKFVTCAKPMFAAASDADLRDKSIAVLGEVYIQYRGHRADDARYEPYFALAEELDIPVGIHLGEGPPAAARFPGHEEYRASMGSPFLLEEVLRRHPKLRIYVMHYASPLVDEMIAMMFTHPNLYVDVSCNNWSFPRAQFHDALKRMVDAGFEKRIMFGSAQMYWPDAIFEAIKAIETAPFLGEPQKRDILYNNAARFLRLTPAQAAADYAPL